MSKYYYTSDEIIKSVKRRIIMPTSQNTFTDQDLLDFATEEINMGLVPLILAEQEDYFLYDEYIQLVPGSTKYTIPYRPGRSGTTLAMWANRSPQRRPSTV